MNPTTTPTAAPTDMDALPTSGGSYTRQPDGSLVRNDPPAEAAPEAADPITDTPQE